MTPTDQAFITTETTPSELAANPWLPAELLKSVSTEGQVLLRRKESRHIVDQPAQLVAAEGTAAWAARIRDISPRGMQVIVDEPITLKPEVKIRWNGRQVSGTIRYNHKLSDARFRIGIELAGRSEELMRELLARQAEELLDANLLLQRQAALAERYSFLLDVASEAIVVSSPAGAILYWNKRAEELYGWTRPEVIGRYVQEVLHSEPKFEPGSAIPGEADFSRKRKDGTTLRVTCRSMIQHDPAGQPQAIVSISRQTVLPGSAHE